MSEHDLIRRGAVAAAIEALRANATDNDPVDAGFRSGITDALSAIATVAASQPADTARVTVKPLVWKNGAGREQVACTIVGTYVVDKHGWARTSDRNMTQAENPKAAAQADYEARILAAIDVQPDPRDAQIAALVEALEAYKGRAKRIPFSVAWTQRT